MATKTVIKKNDSAKPKKDKWGRSEGSKYYNFNPDTKTYVGSSKKTDVKNPAKGTMDELSTRFMATKIKVGETNLFGPNTSNNPKDRSIYEQKILDKDQQIMRSKAAADKAAAEKKAAEKRKVAKMQSSGGYKKDGFAKGGTVTKMRTGGMVNANAKITAAKKATGRVGGISKAPKTASPKIKMGGSMKKKSC